MKKIGLTTGLVVMLASSAWATGNENINTNTNRQKQDQYQNQTQQQNQHQSSTNTNTNAPTNTNTNSPTTTSGSESYSGSASYSGSVNIDTPHQAPAFGVYASGPCSGVAFAVSTVLGGGGVSFTDGECSKREAVRTFFMLGDKETAMAIARTLAAYKAVQKKSEPTATADTFKEARDHQFGQ